MAWAIRQAKLAAAVYSACSAGTTTELIAAQLDRRSIAPVARDCPAFFPALKLLLCHLQPRRLPFLADDVQPRSQAGSASSDSN
jgi:hypothetical protein